MLFFSPKLSQVSCNGVGILRLNMMLQKNLSFFLQFVQTDSLLLSYDSMNIFKISKIMYLSRKPPFRDLERIFHCV